MCPPTCTAMRFHNTWAQHLGTTPPCGARRNLGWHVAWQLLATHEPATVGNARRWPWLAMSIPLAQESHSSHARRQPHQHAGAPSASQAPDPAPQEGVEGAVDGGEDGGARAAHSSPSTNSRGREIWGDNWIRGGLPEGAQDVKQGGSMLEGEADAAAALARARAASASSPGLPPPPIPPVLTDGEGARAPDGASAHCQQSRDVEEAAFGYHMDVHSRSRVVDLYGTAPRGELSRSSRDSALAVSPGWRAGGMPFLGVGTGFASGGPGCPQPAATMQKSSLAAGLPLPLVHLSRRSLPPLSRLYLSIYIYTYVMRSALITYSFEHSGQHAHEC